MHTVGEEGGSTHGVDTDLGHSGAVAYGLVIRPSGHIPIGVPLRDVELNERTGTIFSHLAVTYCLCTLIATMNCVVVVECSGNRKTLKLVNLTIV